VSKIPLKIYLFMKTNERYPACHIMGMLHQFPFPQCLFEFNWIYWSLFVQLWKAKILSIYFSITMHGKNTPRKWYKRLHIWAIQKNAVWKGETSDKSFFNNDKLLKMAFFLIKTYFKWIRLIGYLKRIIVSSNKNFHQIPMDVLTLISLWKKNQIVCLELIPDDFEKKIFPDLIMSKFHPLSEKKNLSAMVEWVSKRSSNKWIYGIFLNFFFHTITT